MARDRIMAGRRHRLSSADVLARIWILFVIVYIDCNQFRSVHGGGAPAEFAGRWAAREAHAGLRLALQCHRLGTTGLLFSYLIFVQGHLMTNFSIYVLEMFLRA